MKEPFYQADNDQQLSALLHELFVTQGQPEVEIDHPVDGKRIITRAEYDDSVRIAKLPPAARQAETQKIARRNTMKLATWMNETDLAEIDLDGEYGKDAQGNDLNIQGKVFVPVDDYPKGIVKKDQELGAFVDESLRERPVRVKPLEGQNVGEA